MEGVMDDLMESSRQAYRQLLEADGFIDFFREATPIDVIESSRIGSRPSRRSGQRSLSRFTGDSLGFCLELVSFLPLQLVWTWDGLIAVTRGPTRSIWQAL